MLLIIFGTKIKTEVVGEGEFFCPSCQTRRKYVHKKGKNYFALYFVALFPIGEMNEFIECQYCGRRYHPEVLKQKFSRPQPDVAKLLNNVKARLENGYPVEYMIRDLTDDGVDLDIARNVVQMAIGDKRKVCPNCELTYAPNILGCSDCDRTLRELQE